MSWASSQSVIASSRSEASSGVSACAFGTRSAASSWSRISVTSLVRSQEPPAIMPSLCRIPATRSRSADVARTAAAAGLFSSWVRPADSEPSASSRSRCPIACAQSLLPKNAPSSRCTAIGNHSFISSANVPASSTKNRDASVARIEAL